MPAATKKTSKAKKTTVPKKKPASTAKKSTAVKKTISTAKTPEVKKEVKKVVKVQAVKSLRMAPDEKHAFMLISTDFDGEKHKPLQVLSTIVLLTILGVMVYLTVLANEIANILIQYSWPS